MSKSSDTKLCLHSSIADYFVKMYPDTSPNIVPVSSRAHIMLEMMNNLSCDVVVIHKDAFDEAVLNDESLCHGKQLLLDEILMSINNVVYASSLASKLSEDFIRYTNKLIAADVYNDIHGYYRNQFLTRTSSSKSCALTDDDLDNSGETQLTALNLFSPLVLAALVATFVLLKHCIRKPVRLKAKQRMGIAIDWKEEDFILSERIRNMKTFKIISGEIKIYLPFWPVILKMLLSSSYSYFMYCFF